MTPTQQSIIDKLRAGAELRSVTIGASKSATIQAPGQIAETVRWPTLSALSRAGVIQRQKNGGHHSTWTLTAPAAPATPAPAAKKTIKVVRTLYGHKGYIGSVRAKEFGGDGGEHDFDALVWLDEMLATGEYALSEKSTLTMSDVDAHRARMSKPVRRVPLPAAPAPNTVAPVEPATSKDARDSRMQVFSGADYVIGNAKQVDVLVAAPSRAQAVRALNAAGVRVSAGRIAAYWNHGSAKERAIALSAPGQVFASSSYGAADYKPLGPAPI